MGLLGALVGLFAVGYLLGIGTAFTVFRDRRRDVEDGSPELLPKPASVRVLGVAGTSRREAFATGLARSLIAEELVQEVRRG